MSSNCRALQDVRPFPLCTGGCGRRVVSLLSVRMGRPPPALLRQKMCIRAVTVNVVAGCVPMHLLHCFIFVAIPRWTCGGKGLWEWGACQRSQGRRISLTLVKGFKWWPGPSAGCCGSVFQRCVQVWVETGQKDKPWSPLASLGFPLKL